jgi:Carboxypeptidase regulatory-like domain
MSDMSSRFMPLLMLLSLLAPPLSSGCRCNPPSGHETTHWVGNMATVFVEKQPRRSLRGRVMFADGKPLGGALVEVFTNPEYLLSNHSYSRGRPGQRRVAACRAAADGKFCFHDLPSGKYELRTSSDDYRGWNVTQVYVVVGQENGAVKDLKVMMTLGI